MQFMNPVVTILLPLPFDHGFSYTWPYPEDPVIGSIVQVPFRSQELFGAIISVTSASDPKVHNKLKQVHLRSWANPLTALDLKFLNWMADYTLIPQGLVLKMMLSVPPALMVDTARQQQLPDPDIPDQNLMTLDFKDDQQMAVDQLLSYCSQDKPKPILLEGVTGSGKTEVYFTAIAQALRQGKQSLILLPEISLTPQWLNRFLQNFGCLPVVWHSNLTPAKRRHYWRWIHQGSAKVIVGARSALHIPYHDLGLIVVDEEHDTSFKQEEMAFYNARDMAVAKASIFKIPCILSSATPALESVYNVQHDKYHHITLSQRYGASQFPAIKLIDLKENEVGPTAGWLSAPLIEAIKSHLTKGEQTLLFLNRRGYAPLTLCRGCGFRIQCPNCAIWLVEHKSGHRLLCHHCGYNCAVPANCPACNAVDKWTACGPGVERIAEEVLQKLPMARSLVMASDVMISPIELNNALDQIHHQHVDIIIGTQIMAKGHHFPHLTLVGVIDADVGLSGGDLRACEKTYQLLHQVAGRCGRAQWPGEVYIQTYNPTHPVMEALLEGDKDSFIQQELYMREVAGMPPYARLASVIVSTFNQDTGNQFTRHMRRCTPPDAALDLFGPAPAPITFLRKKYRWRFLLKANQTGYLQLYIKQWLSNIGKIPPAIKVQIDIDPLNFM